MEHENVNTPPTAPSAEVPPANPPIIETKPPITETSKVDTKPVSAHELQYLERSQQRAPWWHTFLPGGRGNSMALWLACLGFGFHLVTKANNGVEKLADLSSDLNKRQANVEQQQQKDERVVQQQAEVIDNIRAISIRGIGDLKEQQTKTNGRVDKLASTVRTMSEELKRLQVPVATISGTINSGPGLTHATEQPAPFIRQMKPCDAAILTADGRSWTVPRVINHQAQYLDVFPLAQATGGMLVQVRGTNERAVITPQCQWRAQ